jgi:UPF0716 protein FxsA
MRRWLGWLSLAVLVGAGIELALLGVLIWWIGVPWTLGLLIGKSVCGYLLVRRIGGRGWRQFRAAADAGQPPGREISAAAVGVIAATLVLLAGFVGAVVGLMLLIPPVRRAAAGVAERMVERRLTTAAASGVFGPRRVKAERVQAQRVHAERVRPAADPYGGSSGATGSAAGGVAPAGPGTDPPPVIEGEILPPR